MEWISVKDRFPNTKKCLAIYISGSINKLQNLRHDGWFSDTIYACWMKENRFIIESHGPEFPATHWMPLPEKPKET